jgi:hypothetical protein
LLIEEDARWVGVPDYGHVLVLPTFVYDSQHLDWSHERLETTRLPTAQAALVLDFCVFPLLVVVLCFEDSGH